MGTTTDSVGETVVDVPLPPVGDPAVYQAEGFKPPNPLDPTSFTTGQDMSIDLQRKLWVFERVGRSVMGIIILLALLGLFGGEGGLSRATVGSAAGPEVAYPRFERRYRPSTLTVSIPAGTAQDGQVTVWIASAYLEGLEVSTITPDPSEQVASSDGVGFVFPVADPSVPVEISFSLEYERVGRAHGEVWLAGLSPVNFDQLIYP